MEQKESNMGGFKMVTMKSLAYPRHSATIKTSAIMAERYSLFAQKFGQFKLITIASVDGVLSVVDGCEMINTLEKMGVEKAICHDLGEISKKDLIIYRLMLNTNQKRLDYLGIAAMVEEVTPSKNDAKSTSTRTGIPLAEVNRYMDLLSFDWEEFARQEINPNQISLF